MSEGPTKDPDALIRAVLSGEPAGWPADAGDAFGERLLERARRQGVATLLWHALRESEAGPGWPEAGRDRLAAHARRQTAVELLRQQELQQVLQALAEAGLRPVLLKGTALAYTLYPAAALRERCDTDLFLPEDAIDRAVGVLAGLGYRVADAGGGELPTYQVELLRPGPGGLRHILDLHWRISNRQAFLHALDYSEVAARATPVPALGEAALAVSRPHALLHTCLHLAAHTVFYPDDERIIWLYDMDLLLSSMAEEEIAGFRRLAAQRRLRAVCGHALQRTQVRLGVEINPRLLDALTPAGRSEASAHYLRPGAVHALRGDLAALPGVKAKLAWLRRLVVPRPGKVLASYHTSARAWLPLLYVYRLGAGLRRLLTRRW